MNPLLHELYEEGRYGRKASAGFYEYGDGAGPTYEEGDGVGFETLLVWAPIVNEAAKHERTGPLAETLPCDLLVRKAKRGESFWNRDERGSIYTS